MNINELVNACASLPRHPAMLDDLKSYYQYKNPMYKDFTTGDLALCTNLTYSVAVDLSLYFGDYAMDWGNSVFVYYFADNPFLIVLVEKSNKKRSYLEYDQLVAFCAIKEMKESQYTNYSNGISEIGSKVRAATFHGENVTTLVETNKFVVSIPTYEKIHH